MSNRGFGSRPAPWGSIPAEGNRSFGGWNRNPISITREEIFGDALVTLVDDDLQKTNQNKEIVADTKPLTSLESILEDVLKKQEESRERILPGKIDQMFLEPVMTEIEEELKHYNKELHQVSVMNRLMQTVHKTDAAQKTQRGQLIRPRRGNEGTLTVMEQLMIRGLETSMKAIELLDEQTVISHLRYLASLAYRADGNLLNGIVSKCIHNMAKTISPIEKFQIPEIQTLLADSLLAIQKASNTCSGYVKPINYILSQPLTFDMTPLSMEVGTKEDANSFAISAGSGKIIDFKLNISKQRIVALTTLKGLIYQSDICTERQIEVSKHEDSKIGIIEDTCYIVSKKENLIQVVNFADSSCHEIPLNSVFDGEFSAFGVANSKICFVQEKEKELVVNVFKHPMTQSKQVFSIPLEMPTKFVVVSENGINVLQSNNILKTYQVRWDNVEVVDSVFCRVMSISDAPKDIINMVLIQATLRDADSSGFTRQKMSSHASDSDYHLSAAFVSKKNLRGVEQRLLEITNEMNKKMEKWFGMIINNSGKNLDDLTYFFDESFEWLNDLCEMITRACDSKIHSTSVRVSVIVFGLRLVAIRLYIMNKINKMNTADFPLIRSTIAQLVKTDMIFEDTVIENLCVLMTVGFDAIYYGNEEAFVGILDEMDYAVLLVMAMYFTHVKNWTGLLYSFRSDKFVTVVRQMPESMKYNILKGSLCKLHAEQERVVKAKIGPCESYFLPYVRMVIDFAASHIGNRSLDGVIMYLQLCCELVIDEFPEISCIVASHAVPFLQELSTLAGNDGVVGTVAQRRLDGLCFHLGKILRSCMKSIPVVEEEKDLKFFLESRIPYGVDLGDETTWKIENGLSDEQADFLKQLVAAETDSIASLFMDYMYKSVKYLHNARLSPMELDLERVIAAAFMKQLGIVSTAMQFGMNCDDTKIPENLVKIWKAVYNIRRTVLRNRQRSMSLDTLTPSEVQEKHTGYVSNMYKKARLILVGSPMHLNQTEDLSENDRILKELTSFITSNTDVSDVKSIMDLQTKRVQVRLESLRTFRQILLTGKIKPGVGLLHEIGNVFDFISDSCLVCSDSAMVTEIRKITGDIFTGLIEQVVGGSRQGLEQALLLKIIAVRLPFITPDNQKDVCRRLIDHLVEKTDGSAEETLVKSVIWKILSLWVCQYPSPELTKILCELLEPQQSEPCHHKALMLLGVISQHCDSIPLEAVYRCFDGGSPRVIVAAISCLTQLFFKMETVQDIVISMGEKYDFVGFIRTVLNQIGSVLCGRKCSLLPEDAMQESHVIVISEFICCLRTLLSKSSKVNTIVGDILHAILSENRDFNGDIMDSLIGVLAVLGKEVIPLHESGHVISIGKNSSSVLRIDSYDSVTGDIKIDEKCAGDETLMPSVRVCANPKHFTIRKDEVPLLAKLVEWTNENIKNMLSAEAVALVAHLYGFLTVGLQSLENMTVLLENCNLSEFIAMAGSYDTQRSLSIASVLHMIGRGIMSQESFAPKADLKGGRLPYSVVSGDIVTPMTFISLGNGVVSNGLITTEPETRNLFVGDIAVPASARIYYEVKIVEKASNDIFVGFVDKAVEMENFECYGFSFSTCVPHCPFMEISGIKMECNEGDVIGIGYTKQAILFYMNGILLNTSIPFPRVTSLLPMIYIQEKAKLEFNFGEEPFVCDIFHQPEFNIIGNFMKSAAIVRSAEEPARPTTTKLLSDDYDVAMAAKWTEHTKESPLGTSSCQPGDPLYVMIPENIVYKKPSQMYVDIQNGFQIGKPMRVAKILQGGYSMKKMLHKVVYTEIQNGSVVQVLYDPWTNSRQEIGKSVVYDSVVCTVGDVVSRLRRVMTGESSAVMKNRQLYEQTKLMHYIREYSTRMTRYFIFNVMDWYKSTKQLDKLIPIIRPFTPSLIHEVFKVYFSVRSLTVNVRPSDYILSSDGFKVPGDTHSYRRFLRALFVTEPDVMYHFLQWLLVTSLENIQTKPTTLSEMFDLCGEFRYQYMIPPGNPEIVISKMCTDCVGFLPVLAPGHNLQNGLIIHDTPINDSMRDSIYMPLPEVDIIIMKNDTRMYSAAKFGLVPIPKYMHGSLANTTLGSMHILFNVLSIIVSLGKDEQLIRCLKSEFFPMLAQLVNTGNYFVDVFAFDMIIPVTTMLPWNAGDVNDVVERAFNHIATTYRSSIKSCESGEISLRESQSIVIVCLIKLLQLDIESSGVRETSSPEEIGKLYDKYVAMCQSKGDTEFDSLVHSIVLCVGLGFHLPIPIRFPIYQIAEDWASYKTVPSEKDRTPAERRQFFIDNYATFLEESSIMANKWKVRYDEALGKIVHFNKDVLDENPINTNSTSFTSESVLLSLPQRLLFCRLRLFAGLRKYEKKLISTVNIDETSLLGMIVSSCRAALATDVKISRVHSVICTNTSGGDRNLHVTFNRFHASAFYADPTHKAGKSLLAQFVEQVNHDKALLKPMKREAVPWHVDLVGEGATDAGGPGRDLFTETCMEILNPVLGLFMANPNRRNENGPNQDLLIPTTGPLTEEKRNLYWYAGFFVALAYITKSPEPFTFARLVWNVLTSRSVEIEDVFDIDQGFKKFITSVEEADEAQFAEQFSLNFEVQDSNGVMVELIPGGSNVRVTWERKDEYIERCKKFRMKEFSQQLEALRSGFNHFFPETVASWLAPWELELLACGDNQCPVEQLKRHCAYDPHDPDMDRLWKILETFTPQERMLFVKFGCGRMGLPPPGMSWSSNLKIEFVSSSKPDPQLPLPTAATCNSRMTIPRYKTDEWMRKKILAAIVYGADIDQDHEANIRMLADVT